MNSSKCRHCPSLCQSSLTPHMPVPLTTVDDGDKVGWVAFVLEFIALLFPGKSQGGTISACCGLVAFKHLRLMVTHTALPFVPSHLQTGPLLSHLRGPGCSEDLQAGSLGTFKEPLSH